MDGVVLVVVVSVVAEWSKSVAFKAGVSQRRFESGRRQTVTVTACTHRDSHCVHPLAR